MSKLSLKKYIFAVISSHWEKLQKMLIYKTAVPRRQRWQKNPGNNFFVLSICPHIKPRGGKSKILTFSYKDTPYCTALYSTVQHCTTLCTALYNTVQHCTALYNTVQHCTTLYNTVQHCTTLYRFVQHCTALHNTVQYCTALNNTVQYFTTL